MEQNNYRRSRSVITDSNKNKVKKADKFLKLLQVQIAVCVLVILCIIGVKISFGNNFDAVKSGAFDINYKLTNLYDINDKLDNLARENKFIAFILGRKYINPEQIINQDEEVPNQEQYQPISEEVTNTTQASGILPLAFSSNNINKLEIMDANIIGVSEPETEEYYEENSNNNQNQSAITPPITEDKKQKLPEKIYNPLTGSITSKFGIRVDPINKKQSFHTGVDVGISSGTTVKSIMSGTVEKTGKSTVWGNYILLSHKSGFKSFYAHLSSVNVKEGAVVKANATIGKSGNTGRSTGPHLHFEIRVNDKLTNPSLYLSFK